MEKIACVLWKPAGVPDDVFGKGLRAAAPELARRGAGSLRLNIVDEHVAAGTGVRVGKMDPPKAAFATFWLDEADAVHGGLLAALSAHASRVAAYLVVESIPLRNTTQLAKPGERTPGFNLVTGIVPRTGSRTDSSSISGTPSTAWWRSRRRARSPTCATRSCARSHRKRRSGPR
jgi:hypothetical protein